MYGEDAASKLARLTDCAAPNLRDFTTARVDPTAFVHFVAAALDGNFSMLARSYERMTGSHRGPADAPLAMPAGVTK